MSYIVTLSESERLALMALIIEAITHSDISQEYVNCSVSPAVTTTSTQLLDRILKAQAAPIITE